VLFSLACFKKFWEEDSASALTYCFQRSRNAEQAGKGALRLGVNGFLISFSLTVRREKAYAGMEPEDVDFAELAETIHGHFEEVVFKVSM